MATAAGDGPATQPQITAVEPGSLKQGELLTIHGNSFGAVGPNIVLFDDFERGKPGTRVPWGVNSTAPVGAWKSAPTEAPFPVFSDALAVSGRNSWQVSSANGTRPMGSPTFPASTREVFLSYWVTIPEGDLYPGEDTSTDNWKIAWILSDGLCHPDCCNNCSGPCYDCQGYHFNDLITPVRLRDSQLVGCNGWCVHLSLAGPCLELKLDKSMHVICC
jgi:hypothetical protein